MKIMSTLSAAFAIVVSVSLLAVFEVSAGTLDRIKERGKIVVGVKGDYKPWGFYDPDGNLVGMEIDMAKDLANRLDVELELVPVIGALRIGYLNLGKIDLILATLSYSPTRAKLVGTITPGYYSSGANVMSSKRFGFKLWSDLRGKKVCGSQGAYYNNWAATTHGAVMISFFSIHEAQKMLLLGKCVAFLQDSSLISGFLASDPRWTDYEMPMPTDIPRPWVMAVPLMERNEAYGQYVSKVITNWHKSGYLIELEKKWGIQDPHPYLLKMHEKFK